MQEYWESYVKLIDGKKSMVSFNAGVSDFVPDTEYMYLGFVKVKLHHSKEDGLVTDEEANDVGFIEDRLEMESLRYRCGKYIGRIISAGEVNFIYYLKFDFEWANAVKDAMNHFPEYIYEYGSRIDTEWEVYQKLLFPSVREWQIIANHHSCMQLQEQGDDLKIKRAIEHKTYFESEKARSEFIKLVEEQGFIKQKETETTFNGKMIFGVEFYRIDTPFYYDIDEITMKLIDLSDSCNGSYDGWESSLVKANI